MDKLYLGDGVYAMFDGYHIRLTSEDGVSILHEIMLEPEVYAQLRAFAKEVNNKYNVKHFEEE